MMYTVKKVALYNILSLFRIAVILKACGDDMHNRYQLGHWKNSLFKTFLIVIYTALGHKVYAVEDGGKVIATFQLKRMNDSLHFSKLAVSPHSSGKGIGSYCIDFMENEARRLGASALECEVYDKSRHAYDFYINRGFKEVGKTGTLKYSEFVLKKTL